MINQVSSQSITYQSFLETKILIEAAPGDVNIRTKVKGIGQDGFKVQHLGFSILVVWIEAKTIRSSDQLLHRSEAHLSHDLTNLWFKA